MRQTEADIQTNRDRHRKRQGQRFKGGRGLKGQMRFKRTDLKRQI